MAKGIFRLIKKIAKIAGCLLGAAIISYSAVFFIRPSLIVDFYRSWNEHMIFMEIRPLGIEKEISGTPYYKAQDAQWSPQKKYFSYFDNVREAAEKPYNKEWALKIIDPRRFAIRTIFIGDYKISEYQWIDDETVRVYMDAGTGVRIYRDISATEPAPFIAADYPDPEYWTPQITYRAPGD